MRVVYSSDFHIDASDTARQAVRRIAKYIEAAGADVVVIAGDAGNTLETLGEVLSYFSRMRIPKFFVAGNHDVWVEKTGTGQLLHSREKYETHIPRVCEQHGFVDLSREPVVLDGVGFVGSLGWYDYSFADPELGLRDDDYWKGEYEDKIWWDKRMALWLPRSHEDKETAGERLHDPEVCQEMASVLDDHLRVVDTQVERIVGVVHTLPFVESLPRSDPPYYMDAFTGGGRIGETLTKYDKVTHHIGGHKHLNGDWIVGGVESHRRTMGRLGDDSSLDDIEKHVVGVIEV